MNLHSRIADITLLYALGRCDWSRSAWNYTLVLRTLYFPKPWSAVIGREVHELTLSYCGHSSFICNVGRADTVRQKWAWRYRVASRTENTYSYRWFFFHKLKLFLITLMCENVQRFSTCWVGHTAPFFSNVGVNFLLNMMNLLFELLLSCNHTCITR